LKFDRYKLLFSVATDQAIPDRRASVQILIPSCIAVWTFKYSIIDLVSFTAGVQITNTGLDLMGARK